MNTKEQREVFFKITHKTYPALNYNQIISNLFDTYNVKAIFYINNMFNNYKKNYSNKINNKIDLIKKIGNMN